MSIRRKIVTISLPPEMADEYEKLAARLDKNKSQLFREMFRLFKAQELLSEYFELQRYGTKAARKKGFLTERDVDRIVFERR